MDKQVKAGDKVKATDKASGWSDITPGNVYEVYAVYGGTIQIKDDVGDQNVLSQDEYELVSEPQDIYLISGFSSEFPTLEAAEQRLTDGYGLHGEEYRIAKLVKTVRVSRVTTTTLEAV
jgi:hypothetical protein